MSLVRYVPLSTCQIGTWHFCGVLAPDFCSAVQVQNEQAQGTKLSFQVLSGFTRAGPIGVAREPSGKSAES